MHLRKNSRDGDVFNGRGIRAAVVFCVIFILLFTSSDSAAQYLRLGPMDFEVETTLEGVYTTNVEGERASEATADREDYFLVAALSLAGETRISPSTSLRLDTGVSVEEHFNRSDLNNSENPFATISASTRTAFRHISLALDASYQRLSESADDVFVPGGRKKRDVHDVVEYGGVIEWAYRAVTLGGDYSFSRERHDDEEFQNGDEDETTIGAFAELQLSERISLSYDYERQKTELVNEGQTPGTATGVVQQIVADDDEDDAPWEVTQTIGLNVDILRKPSLRYTLGYEKEDQGEEEGEWEITHTLSLSDDVELFSARNVTVSANASYTFEEDEEEEDIAFTYAVKIVHMISRTAEHSLSMTREPVETFGSTTDTDSTTYSYDFKKLDLFIYNLDLKAGVSYSRDEPLGPDAGSVEKSWEYYASLLHSRVLTRKMTREFEYSYSMEDLNTEDELLEEHRVMLRFVYTF